MSYILTGITAVVVVMVNARESASVEQLSKHLKLSQLNYVLYIITCSFSRKESQLENC